MSSTANRVIKNTGYLYAKMGITMFVSLYTTRLILNSLGASDFGIFNIVGGAIAMLGFLNAAMASATQRFMSYSEGAGDKEKQKSIFNISLVIHFLTALLVGVALVVAGFFFFGGILNIPSGRVGAAEVVYGSLIVSTMFTVMTVPYDAVMNAHENMRYYAIVGILESLLKLAVAFACVYITSDKLIVYGILMACIPLVTLTIMRVYCHKHYKECVISPRKYYDHSTMKEMLSFFGWNLMGSLSGIVVQNGFSIILNIYFGVILNAAQGLANQITGVIQTLSQNALKALNPIIVKSEGAGNERMFEYSTFLGCRIAYSSFAFFSIPLILEMPLVLKLWVKHVPEHAVVFCSLALIRILIEIIVLPISTAVSAHGDIKSMTLWKSLAYAIPLFIVPFLFHIGLEPYWMYLVWIVCWSLMGNIIVLYYAKKKIALSIRFYSKQVLTPCIFVSLLSIALYIALRSTHNCSIPYKLLDITAYVVISLFLNWTYMLNAKERNYFKGCIQNVLNRMKH